jgi:galactokinase
MTSPPPEDLGAHYHRFFGSPPEGLWSAPGRVNLIGEHTDYNLGYALPFAIDRTTTVALGRSHDHMITMSSLQMSQKIHVSVSDLSTIAPSSWARYPLGVVWALQHRGFDIPGFSAIFSSTVPLGSGLSSSAAILAATACSLNDLLDLNLTRDTLIDLCHEAEVDFVGAPVGYLDQIAVLSSQAGFGVLIDFLDLSTVETPLPLHNMLVVDSRSPHRNVSGDYAQRRRECEAAASTLGLKSLREATLEQVEAELTGVERHRARHVTTENDRVLETARRLNRHQQIGDLLTASHISLRDDFAVSSRELDLIVETALQLGASGARMIGGGFGGSALVLGLPLEALQAALDSTFSKLGFPLPHAFEAHSSHGARRVA